MRAERSLIQTIGRAARNANGQVIMYADHITDSMRVAMDETMRRREKQLAYNEEHGITPQTIQKAVRDVIEATKAAESQSDYLSTAERARQMSAKDRRDLIRRLENEMKEAAKALQFERAAELRDMIVELSAS